MFENHALKEAKEDKFRINEKTAKTYDLVSIAFSTFVLGCF